MSIFLCVLQNTNEALVHYLGNWARYRFLLILIAFMQHLSASLTRSRGAVFGLIYGTASEVLFLFFFVSGEVIGN